MNKNVIIGFDLDNTIICYDKLFYTLAIEAKLIDNTDNIVVQKTAIRDYIRKFYGDIVWQKLQAQAYGSHLYKAEIFPHALETVKVLSKYDLKIISHKTQYSNLRASRIDLRQAALNFLEEQQITKYVQPKNIFFADSQRDKIHLISQTHCQIFVDDLYELLLNPEFPKINKILFANSLGKCTSELENIKACTTWKEINEYIFKLINNTLH